jgi:hypothetical protein
MVFDLMIDSMLLVFVLTMLDAIHAIFCEILYRKSLKIKTV